MRGEIDTTDTLHFQEKAGIINEINLNNFNLYLLTFFYT